MTRDELIDHIIDVTSERRFSDDTLRMAVGDLLNLYDKEWDKKIQERNEVIGEYGVRLASQDESIKDVMEFLNKVLPYEHIERAKMMFNQELEALK